MKSLNVCNVMNTLVSSNWMRGFLYLTVAAFTIPELIWTGMFLITVF